ncbi:MAG TPA: hypothetical protein VNA20_15675 [Frankiaceae bacterium]|nr:hypothetical protein [Frankiaceae bacterium]
MRISVAALAAAVALSGLVAAPARAAVTQPAGEPCRLSTAGTGDGFTVRGGPLLLADEDDPTVVHTGTVTCSFVTRAVGDDHAATPWFTATSPVGTGVAYLPPVEATYPGPWEDRHYLCTRADVDGQALYWHDPRDRNSEGWWTTAPSSPCAQTWETLDMRFEDPPHGYAVSAAFAAVGEVDGIGAADTALCTVPEVAAVVDEHWGCGLPSGIFTMAFARAAGVAVLRNDAPKGWSCTDVHTGLPVGRGSLLAVPNPGVTCALLPGAAPQECFRVQVSGALAPATLGRVTMTGSCGSLAVTRTFAPGAARVAELWSSDFGTGTPPVHCVANEDAAHSGEVAYLAQCTFA